MHPLEETTIKDPGLLKQSLTKGADPDTAGPHGQTPLHVASKEGLVRSIELLLAHGATLDHHDDFGNSALLMAVGYGHVQAARLLLSSGALMSYSFKPDPESKTQLELADSMARSIRSTRDRMPESFNDLPEDLAAELTSEEHLESMITDFREMHFMESHKHAIAECHHFEMLVMLVDEFGADLDHVDPGGYWPLKSFAEDGNVKAVRWLLEHGAKVDQTSTGETALFTAIGSDDPELIRLLIKAGANVNQQDVDQCVPLWRCMSPAGAQLLLDAGADPTIRDQCGFPSWHFVKDPETRQLIIDAAENG